jgi:hypothetical protein
MRKMPKFDPRMLRMGFVVGEMALRQVFLQILRFSLLISFYQVSVLIVCSSTTYPTQSKHMASLVTKPLFTLAIAP